MKSFLVKTFLFLVILTVIRFNFSSIQNLIQNGKIERTKERKYLKLGYLPVTCHLTCPVLDYSTKTSENGTKFTSVRFADFPTVATALQTKQLMASFMLAPLALKMREDGVPVKICYLGHREGSQLVVQKNSNYKSIKDLKGKKIAIPSLYSNQHFILTELLRKNNLSASDITFIQLPPPDMLTSLASGAIDGYFVGEPFCAKAEMEKVGRILDFSGDIWPGFISCVLVVHEDLIKQDPEVVKDLVRGIAESGLWIEQHRNEASYIASSYYRQPLNLLQFILNSKKKRVRYDHLSPTEEEFKKIESIGIELGLLKKSAPIKDALDLRFIPDHINEINVDVTAAK